MIPRIGCLVLCTTALVGAQEKAIETKRSTITIHVGKAGLFSAAGHEHWIEAPLASGVINESNPAHVEFKVEAAKMQVKPDPKVDAGTQSQVQKDMQEKVLESAKFPDIVFRSSRVEKEAEGQWRVEGALMLHGVTRQLSVPVTRSGDAYIGRTTLRQTEFGIKPITAAGGTVKVKDELDIEFRVFTSTRQVM